MHTKFILYVYQLSYQNTIQQNHSNLNKALKMANDTIEINKCSRQIFPSGYKKYMEQKTKKT